MMMEDQRLWSGGYLAHVAAWAIERGSHTNWLPINLTSGQSSLSCFPSSLAFVLFFVYSFDLLLSITYSVFLLALQIQVSSHSVFSICCVSGWSPQVRTYLEILIFVSLGTPLTAHPNTQSDVAKPLISPAPIFFCYFENHSEPFRVISFKTLWAFFRQLQFLVIWNVRTGRGGSLWLRLFLSLRCSKQLEQRSNFQDWWWREVHAWVKSNTRGFNLRLINFNFQFFRRQHFVRLSVLVISHSDCPTIWLLWFWSELWRGSWVVW